jgi:transcriptional regulator with XRE-family HTH domain
MPDSSNLVKLALKELKINQKQLADKLAVSTGQISRWKNHDDYMSLELSDKLTKLCGLEEIPAEFALLTGSVVSAQKWEKVIRVCASEAEACNETGYECYPLIDFEDWVILSRLSFVLIELGITFPVEIPDPINELFDDGDLDDAKWDQFYKLEHVNTILSIFSALTDIISFHSAYIDVLWDDYGDNLNDLVYEIQDGYLCLAACKIKISSKLAPNFEAFRHDWNQFYKQKLVELKAAAVAEKVPLREELLKLVNDEVGDISSAAERQSLGLNDANLHPDIYMNELLIGMRAIHQVLPAIMKKLGIEEEFQLDESDFYSG